MGEMAYSFFKKHLTSPEEYEGTEFRFPILYGLTGEMTATQEMIDGALARIKDEKGGHFLDALWLAEQVESGYPDHSEKFISDDRFRSNCLGLNEGTNAWALLLGGGDNLVPLASKLQSKRFKVYAAGRSSGILGEAAQVDLGDRDTGVVYFGQLMARYALIYARADAGSSHAITHEIEENAPGVMFVAGELTGFERLMAQSLLALGVPSVILGGSQDLVGMVYEEQSIEDMVSTAWKLPNVRARLVEKAVPDVPIEVGPVFSREKIDNPSLEVKGSENSFVVVVPNHNISNNGITVIGEESNPSDFSILVELGNPAVDDIVTVGVEGTLLRVIKYIRGVQVNLVGGSVESLKVTQKALDSGFKLEHLSKVIRVELRNKFPEIGPIGIKVILDKNEVDALGEQIREYKAVRKNRIDEATDENVDEFYGCMRCASFSLSHACTVSPERPSQCGSSPWWVLKAQALLAPGDVYNKSTIIEKGELLDPVRGEYSGVNEATRLRTNGRVSRVYMHSIFGHPHTACSCFQNIAYYIPELDGIGLMDRGYIGEAPGGWTWTRLANNVAGYQNTDGFATFATQYLSSSKFLQADGGYERVVWMSDKLKSIAGDSIPKDRKKKIATEKEATTLKQLEESLNPS